MGGARLSQTEKDASHPLVMRTAYGMGEVTVVGFDLTRGRSPTGTNSPSWGNAPDLKGGAGRQPKPAD